VRPLADFLHSTLLLFPFSNRASFEAFANALFLNFDLIRLLALDLLTPWFRNTYILLKGASCILALFCVEPGLAKLFVPRKGFACVTVRFQAHLCIAGLGLKQGRTRVTTRYGLLSDRPGTFLFATTALLVAITPRAKRADGAVLAARLRIAGLFLRERRASGTAISCVLGDGPGARLLSARARLGACSPGAKCTDLAVLLQARFTIVATTAIVLLRAAALNLTTQETATSLIAISAWASRVPRRRTRFTSSPVRPAASGISADGKR